MTVAVEDGTTEAGPQFLRLGQICADLAGYDARVRQYVAAEEFLWDWLEDAGVSHEGFE